MVTLVQSESAETLETKVRQSDLPVLVDFWAPWCGPCKTLAPTIDTVAAEMAEKLVVTKINVDDNAALAGKYKIRAVPTVILFVGGEEVERMVGATSKQTLLRTLSKHL